VETAQDIVNELPGALAGIAAPVEQNEVSATAAGGVWRSPEYQRLLELMGWDPVSVNTLVKRAGLTPEVVSSMLLLLELEDRVDSLAGGRYQQREEGR
jgi:DNA processing protein